MSRDVQRRSLQLHRVHRAYGMIKVHRRVLPFTVQSMRGVVHVGVGQKLLNCNIFKSLFQRPTGTRVEGRSPALGGHIRP